MRFVVALALASIILSACASPAHEQTVTPVPSLTSTPSVTPTPSITPTPTEIPLPPSVAEISKKLNDSDYLLGWGNGENTKEKIVLFYTDPKTKERTEVPEIAINPEDASITRTYLFTPPTELGYEPATLIVSIEPGELVSGDMEGWKLIDGKLVKQGVIDDNGVESKTSVNYSRAEATEMLLQDASKFPKEEMDNENSKSRTLDDARTRIKKLLQNESLTNQPAIVYEGIKLNTLDNYSYYSRVYTIDNLTNKIASGEVPTMFYVYTPLRLSEQTYLMWERKDGKFMSIIIDKKLLMYPQYKEIGQMGPFSIQQ